MDKTKKIAEKALSEPETHLDGMGERLYLALRLREKQEVDKAAEVLRGILKVEPRLAEPRMELARILLDTGQLDEARTQAEEAVRILETGGQWIDDLPENVVLSLGFDLLGEIIRRQADVDEVVFGDPETWRALVQASDAAFGRAAELDPENEHARYWAKEPTPPTE
jgi:tetratricopeptide (TPR) repeat protein